MRCGVYGRRVQGLDATAARTFYSLRSGLDRLGVELVLTHLALSRSPPCLLFPPRSNLTKPTQQPFPMPCILHTMCLHVVQRPHFPALLALLVACTSKDSVSPHPRGTPPSPLRPLSLVRLHLCLQHQCGMPIVCHLPRAEKRCSDLRGAAGGCMQAAHQAASGGTRRGG